MNLEIEHSERLAYRKFCEVIRVTSELFGEVGIKESFDPEFADDRYLVRIVRAKGSVQELLALEMKWIERVSKLANNCESFRLSLRPIE